MPKQEARPACTRRQLMAMIFSGHVDVEVAVESDPVCWVRDERVHPLNEQGIVAPGLTILPATLTATKNGKQVMTKIRKALII